jgi:hypothetical protein
MITAHSNGQVSVMVCSVYLEVRTELLNMVWRDFVLYRDEARTVPKVASSNVVHGTNFECGFDHSRHGSLPCPQEPATALYLNPHESSLDPQSCLQDSFQYYPPTYISIYHVPMETIRKNFCTSPSARPFLRDAADH